MLNSQAVVGRGNIRCSTFPEILDQALDTGQRPKLQL
jgi:hypothetical protein